MVLTASTPPSNSRMESTAFCTVAATGRARNSVVMRPAAVSSRCSSSSTTSCCASGCIWVHFADDIGCSSGIERLYDRLLNLGFDFLQGLGCDALIQSLEYSLAFVGSQVFDNVGNVGRVQLCETLVGDFKFHAAGGIRLDHVNKIPRNRTGRNPAEERLQCRPGGDAAQQAPDGSTSANVHRQDAQNGIRPTEIFLRIDLQIDVVDPDHFSSVDVDHLLIEQISLQQKQTLSAVGWQPLCSRGRGSYAAVDRRYRGEGQNPVA